MSCYVDPYCSSCCRRFPPFIVAVNLLDQEDLGCWSAALDSFCIAAEKKTKTK
jgi:hypothetical protein